jgi:hypothetical protein
VPVIGKKVVDFANLPQKPRLKCDILLFMTVFAIKKASSAAERRFHEGGKAVCFPIYNVGISQPSFSSNE